jgi:MFS family permease
VTKDVVSDGGRPGSALRANAAFRRLWLARSVSAFGDSLGLVALIIYVEDTAGAAFAVATLLLVGELVPSLLGPFSGALTDRFDRRRLMVLSELVQAVAVLLIAITLPPVPLLLPLVAVQGLAGQVLQPAARSVIPVWCRIGTSSRRTRPSGSA